MTFPMAHFTWLTGQPRRGPVRRQIVPPLSLAAALALGVLAGCSSFGGLQGGAEGYVKGFNGAVAGDEPFAVLNARDILAAGGSAADAVVAAYFTMAVTLPSAASLGAGGVCLVYDAEKETAEALDFTHPSLPLPTAPRAMLALHAKYGLLPWTQMVGPAESLARFGHPASRAFARALAQAPAAVSGPGMEIFAGESGNPMAEGTRLRQVALAGTLSLIRRQPAQLASGVLIHRIAEDYQRAGVALTAQDLRAAVPRFRPVVTVTRGNQTAHFPPNPAGIVTAQAWAMLFAEGAWDASRPADRPHLLAEVSKRAFADAGRWFRAPGGVPDPAQPIVEEERIETLLGNYDPERPTPAVVPDSTGPVPAPVDQGSASIIAADVFGQAVACAFTMNGTMGMGRMAPETGIVIAAPPDPAGRGAPALGLMAVRLDTQHQLEYLAAATGGAEVPITLAAGAAELIEEGTHAEQILGAPRLYHPANPDEVVIEDRDDARDTAQRLRAKGHRVAAAPTLGRVNLFVCPRGFDGERSQCDVRADRRAHGLAQQN